MLELRVNAGASQRVRGGRGRERFITFLNDVNETISGNVNVGREHSEKAR